MLMLLYTAYCHILPECTKHASLHPWLWLRMEGHAFSGYYPIGRQNCSIEQNLLVQFRPKTKEARDVYVCDKIVCSCSRIGI